MAIGIWAGVSALALAIGPLLGGIITEHISWNWIFYVNVPIGVLAVIAAIVVVPESKRHLARAAPRPARPAHLGHRLARARLRADRGDTSTAGRRPASSALRDRGGGARRVRAARDAPAACRCSTSRSSATAPSRARTSSRSARDAGDVRDLRLLPDVHADHPRLVADPGGAALLPWTVMIVIFAPIAGKLSDRVGSRWLMAGGMTVVAACCLLLSHGHPALDLLAHAPGVPARRARDVVRDDADVGCRDARGAGRQGGRRLGVLNTFRQVGVALGIAIMGAIVATASASRRRPRWASPPSRRSCTG